MWTFKKDSARFRTPETPARAAVWIVVAAASLAGGVLVSAAEIDGTVDSSFASDGVAYVDGVGFSKMAVDSEGRILLAAGIDDDPDASGPDLIRVSRLAADGTIDTSFGSNGSTNITGLSGWSYLQLMTLMVDGQDRPVVIMGANGLPQEADTGAVVRFTEAGALDTAFGGDGYAVLTTESARSNMAPNIGFIDATSGNIYALGGINGVDLYRVTAAGAQDTSFFSDGVLDFDYYNEADVPLFDMGFGFRGNPVALSVDSDESGATVAFTKSVSDEARLLMIKIDFSADETVPFSRTWGPDNYGIPTTYTRDSVTDGADGTPDGIVDTGIPLLELVRAKILSDGSLVAWMTGQNDPYASRVARVDADGNLLSSFSSNGYTDALELFDSYLQPELVVNGDGSFSLIGKTDDYSVLARVVRFGSDGSLDASFGTGGSYDLSACERGSLQSAVRADSGSVYVLSKMSESTGDGENIWVSRITKLGSGGSSTACGTTTSSPGSGSDSGDGSGPGPGPDSEYTPPEQMDPAPVFTVGEADGGLVVCVAVNGSPANYVSVNVSPLDFDYPDSEPDEGTLLPSTYKSMIEPDLASSIEDGMGPSEYLEWDGGDLAISFDALILSPYSSDGPADPSLDVAEPFEVGAAYQLFPYAEERESWMSNPVSEYFSEPLVYTFTGVDVGCGVEPGSAGSDDSAADESSSVPGGVVAPGVGAVSERVTESNASTFVRSPGEVSLVDGDGNPVIGELVRVSDEVGSVPAASRTPEQVAQIRSEAVALVEALSSRAPEGSDVPVQVVETETGANLSGLVTDPADGTSDLPVPVEDVVLLVTDEQALLLGGADGPADPADLRGGVLELGPDGEVSALAYGLTPGASGELVVMPSPTLMGTFAVGADGSFQGQAALPSTLGAGAHTVVLAVDGLVASAGVVVTGEVMLPVTGSGSSSVPWAVLVVAAGALAVLMIRRRVVV
jgi:uncharacterized delta-60 repeat protein